MRRIQSEGVDRNKLIAAYTEMWIDAETDTERSQLWEVVRALTGAQATKKQAATVIESQEVNKQLGPIATTDPDLDTILKQLKGGR